MKIKCHILVYHKISIFCLMFFSLTYDLTSLQLLLYFFLFSDQHQQPSILRIFTAWRCVRAHCLSVPISLLCEVRIQKVCFVTILIKKKKVGEQTIKKEICHS